MKNYSQKPSFNYEKTFSLIAMLKSIKKKLLSIATHLNYKIWKMDVKTVLLINNIGNNIYVMQLDGFIAKNQEHTSIKQASYLWNKHFNKANKSFDFNQNEGEPCVYKKVHGIIMVFMVLYVDDVLPIGNDVRLFL